MAESWGLQARGASEGRRLQWGDSWSSPGTRSDLGAGTAASNKRRRRDKLHAFTDSPTPQLFLGGGMLLLCPFTDEEMESGDQK